MIINKRHLSLIMILTCTILSFVCTSCTMFQPPQPVKPEKQPSKVSPPVIQRQFEPFQYAALEQKADADIKAKKYRSALNTYNHLLSKYSGKDKEKLLAKTEALLSIMENSDLEIALKSSKKQIPEYMLLYQLGANYALKKEDDKAKEMLGRFLADYPDHPRAEQVKKILAEIEARTFAKNTIGCMLPLSGKYQTFGKQALKGIQMAQQDLKVLYNQENRNQDNLNQKNLNQDNLDQDNGDQESRNQENKNQKNGDQENRNNEIVFIIKDTESNDNRAVECVKELAKTNIAAIAGPMVTSEAAAKEAQKQKIPMICITQKSDVTSAGDYIFSNFITPEIQINGLVAHARQRLGVKNFAILYPDDKYGQTFMSLFRQAVSEAGGELVVAEVYTTKQTDFSSAIKKLAAITPHDPNAQSQNSNIAADSSSSDGASISGNSEGVSGSDTSNSDSDSGNSKIV
ncbi:MAG: ABC transporter substrate-binding protein, partial [Desulfamplus sp.]|nr:ABC transporter substrate-binding protein [Desulfamplus sp.]